MSNQTQTPEMLAALRAVPVAGDRVYYSGTLTSLHGFGTVAHVVYSEHRPAMAVVDMDPTLTEAGGPIRCRRSSIEVVSTASRCDNCGANHDSYPVTFGGVEWAYCGPCRDMVNTRAGRI